MANIWLEFSGFLLQCVLNRHLGMDNFVTFGMHGLNHIS